MITDLAALKIKAAAYDRIHAQWAGRLQSAEELGYSTFHICKEVDVLLEAATFDTVALNERLRQSRMRRLQSTQFVYCPHDHYPRIKLAKGEEMLWEREERRIIKSEADAYEQLAQTEIELFDTEDEAVVFWRGQHLWSFASLPDQDQWLATCTFYRCWRYDNEVHIEPRHVKSVFRIDPTALGSDARRYVNENQNRWTGKASTSEEPK